MSRCDGSYVDFQGCVRECSIYEGCGIEGCEYKIGAVPKETQMIEKKDDPQVEREIARDKWHDRFMGLAAYVARWSKDPSTQVGAVIVNDLRIPLGLGFNGFPRGVEDDGRLQVRETKLKIVVHAEANAILNCSLPPRGATLYCTHHPCSECAKLIIQSGIQTVVCPSSPTNSKWAEDHAFSRMMMNEALLEIIYIDP